MAKSIFDIPGRYELLLSLPLVDGGREIKIIDGRDYRKNKPPRVYGAWVTPLVCGDHFAVRYQDSLDNNEVIRSHGGINPLISWQVAHLLSKSLRRLRLEKGIHASGTFDTLYRALRGAVVDVDIAALAQDFNVNIEDFHVLLESARSMYPPSNDICSMWIKVNPARRAMMVLELDAAIDAGLVIPSDRLEKLVYGRNRISIPQEAPFAPRLPVSPIYGITRVPVRINESDINKFRTLSVADKVRRYFGI